MDVAARKCPDLLTFGLRNLAKIDAVVCASFKTLSIVYSVDICFICTIVENTAMQSKKKKKKKKRPVFPGNNARAALVQGFTEPSISVDIDHPCHNYYCD